MCKTKIVVLSLHKYLKQCCDTILLFAEQDMAIVAEYVSRTRIGAYFHQARESRKLVLLIVAIALLLDNMLLTTVGKYRKTCVKSKNTGKPL